MKLLDYVKKQVSDAIPIFNAMQMWIILKLPRVEDGNNFGVSVQKDTIEALSDAQEQLRIISDNISMYYRTRGEAVSFTVRFSEIRDYIQAVMEIDESQFYSLKLYVKSLRNIYASIYDSTWKNIDNLQNPRHSTDSISSFF